MPPPLTVPPPDGKAFVVRVYLRVKLAVTDLFPFIVTVQAPVPLQSPVHLVKR